MDPSFLGYVLGKYKIILIAALIITVCAGLWSESDKFSNFSRKKEQGASEHGNSNPKLQRSRRQAVSDSECSNNYTVGAEGGKITSPGYPEEYSSNLDCQWRLISSTESNIILKFTDMSIEETDDCEYDYIAVYDGNSNIVEKLCGSYSDKILATNATSAVIHFHSDASYTEKGFVVEYFLEKKSDCQMFMKENEGVLTSPQYPDNYPDKTDCWTLINVDENASILLKFDVLNLEYDANCTFDYVAAYDGTTVDSPFLGHFCSNPENATVTSTNNTMLVHFHSDHLLNYNGFSATYTSIFLDRSDKGGCQWNKDKRNGTISSPNYPYRYERNSNCIIKVQAPENFLISLFIDDITMEAGANCTYDWLETRDGLTQESPLLGKFCGNINEERNLTSTNNGLYFSFSSDDFAEFNGFHLQYWFHSNGEQIQDNEDTEDVTTARPLVNDVLHSTSAFTELPQNSSAISGQSHIMSCKPKDPTAKIRWLKDGQFLGGPKPLQGLSLMANGTILWIHSMSADFKGIYTCAAVMPNGVSHSVQVHVDIKEQPENCDIHFKHRPVNMTISEGDSNFVQCSLFRSTAEISWLKNGIPIPSSKEHYQQLINGFLLLDKAVPEMSGVYTCVAKNKTSGCTKHSSALILVPQRVNIKNVCGRPITGKPNTQKPQVIREKVIGGNKTEKGAYPWQVQLFYGGRGICGGSLLNEHWVLTAAHCLFIRKLSQLIERTKMIIKLGKHNQEIVEPEEVLTGIETFVFHPAYDKGSYDSDIALIKLQDGVQFTDYISPVCLGDQEFIRDLFFKRSLRMGTVTGWGRLTEKGPQPHYLQELRIPVVNWETCRQSTKYHVTKNMFCAGYAQEIIGDACKGDSGGPFVMEQDNIWYLIGVVSWGEGCGHKGQYGFYTKVDNYHTWIKGIIN